MSLSLLTVIVYWAATVAAASATADITARAKASLNVET